MALRLSSSPTTSTANYVNRLVGDPSRTMLQKKNCLTVLKVVLKNLVDPSKSGDIKYRTLKLDNPKLQEKLFSIPYIKEMLEQTLGFEESTTPENDPCLVMTTLPSDLTILRNCLDEVSSSLAAINASSGGDISGNIEPLHQCNKKPRLPPTEQLSEKQKARRLMEEKDQLEREKAKEERKRQVQLLKQDKLVRETDPNWKPGVSAACAKSGTGISTFRDKYGEN